LLRRETYHKLVGNGHYVYHWSQLGFWSFESVALDRNFAVLVCANQGDEAGGKACDEATKRPRP
jgi:hypothetical protein